MDILNDLTKCNFYYYILRTNKAYLIFKYLQLIEDDICIGDALVRRQPIIVDNNVVRVLNKDIKQQYQIINELQLNKNINLNYELIKYTKLGYLLVIQYLVSIGADINSNNNLALRLAAAKDHLLIVKYLLQPYGLNNFLNRKYGSNIHTEKDYALQLAAQNGNLQILQYLVSKGANIHADDDWALRWVAQNGHLQIVQYLISVGANANKLTAKQKLKYNIE